MKKRIAGILISILLLSTLSGCGKDKDFSYVDEPASTSDATNASVLHRNYEVTDGLLTFTVDSDVDTSLSAQSSPVVKVSRNDYTEADMKRIADAIFDAGSYALFLPYVLRPDEEVKSACADMQEEIAQYNDSADIPYSLLQEYYIAQQCMANDNVVTPIHTDGSLKWYRFTSTENADIYTNFCVIKGTISQKPYYLSFIQTDAYCTMLLHTIYEPYIQYPQYYDTYANPLYENESYSDECQYSKEESKAMVLDTLRTMGISDYTITDVQKAQTIKPDYEITKDGEIIASDSSNDGYSYDSYLLYGGRNVDGIAPVHTDFNFSRELVSGTIGENSSSNDSYTNTRYGFEAIFANVGNDGINYLVIQNPMKVEEVLETNAQLLSFDQIDAIAKDYISKFDGTTLPFSADNTYKIKEIQYGLIRLFDEESDSYMYIPAWYYMIDGESLSSPFCTFSPYVIISAIDGSIYHDYNGNIN